MRVTVLGCSGTYAGAGTACSGYLVQSGGVSVLVDAGPGTLAELQRHIPLAGLDAVLLSHSHPDHWVEVPVLRNALRYVLECDGLALFSTSETLEMITAVCHDAVAPTFEMQPISDGTELKIQTMTVRCSRTEHPPETLGFCIDDGEHRVAYSADTGAGWGFDEFGAPLDLGICEATFREGDLPQADARTVHMTARDAGKMARATRTGRLVLTHLLPGADAAGARREAEDAYGASVQLAESGLVLDV